LTNPASVVVADASVVINLNATGCAQQVITALPNSLVVVDVVRDELEKGRGRGRQDADLLNELTAGHVVQLVTLGDAALSHFERLVIGPAASTLDDGEAATIAYAIAHGTIPLVDERKATRLSAERFPHLLVGCTLDIFKHADVLSSLGRDALASAVFNALHHGRMRVFPMDVAWVLALIGAERAALCASLPASVRQSPLKPVDVKTPSIRGGQCE
jgi:predicted nucleic acid-binding protein